MFVEQPQSIVEIVAPTSGGRLGTGCEIGACSLLGIEERPRILLLSLVLTTLIVSNAAPQRDAARHVRVMSVLFKAGELERPTYAYASYASFSASWFSSPCVAWPSGASLVSAEARVQPIKKLS